MFYFIFFLFFNIYLPYCIILGKQNRIIFLNRVFFILAFLHFLLYLRKKYRRTVRFHLVGRFAAK